MSAVPDSILPPTVLWGEDRYIRGLADPDGPTSGRDANGDQAVARMLPMSLDNLFDAETRFEEEDAHVVQYLVLDKDGTPLPMQCRLRKESLAPIRARGHQVVATSVIIDLDLAHIDGGDLLKRFGKKNAVGKLEVGWTDLPEDVTEALLQRLDVHPEIGQWRWAYSTEHGVRYVHVLDRPVPVGSNFEDLIDAVIKSYWKAGLPADAACRDWTRMFRAPQVTKENGLRTWEQPWFFVERNDAALLQVPEEFMVVRDERRAPGVRHNGPCPDDDQAESLIYSAPGQKTALGEALEKRLRKGEIYMYIFGSTPFTRGTGDRHKKLTQIVGILCQEVRRIPGGTVELVYAGALQAIKSLAQDEDWRGKSWEMARSYWARDGGDPAPASAPDAPAATTTAADRNIAAWRATSPLRAPEWAPEPPAADPVAGLPDFPLQSLPPVLRAMAETVSSNVQIAPDLSALMAMVVVAMAASRSAVVQVGTSHEEVLALWAVISQESGERKSAAFRMLIQPLAEREEELLQAYDLVLRQHNQEMSALDDEIESYKRDIRKASNPDAARHSIAQVEAKRKDPPPSPGILVSDATIEAIKVKMRSQGGRVGIVSAEGGMFAKLADNKSKTQDLDPLLQGYSGDAVRESRVGRGDNYIREAVVNLAICMQPHVLTELACDRRFAGVCRAPRYMRPRAPVPVRRQSRPPPQLVLARHRP